jgi:hypothetical protein
MKSIKLNFDTICQFNSTKNKDLNPRKIEAINEFDSKTETNQDKVLLVDRKCSTRNRSAVNI